MEKFLGKIKAWYMAQKAESALRRFGDLEKHRKFIDRFFLGETQYEIELERWRREIDTARKKYEALKQYL